MISYFVTKIKLEKEKSNKQRMKEEKKFNAVLAPSWP